LNDDVTLLRPSYFLQLHFLDQQFVSSPKLAATE
jgi:hypothetical protein